MKTTIIKIGIVLSCMVMGFTPIAKGQIYSSEDCFYARAGENEVCYVVKFQGSKVWLKRDYHSGVRHNLAKSKNYYENEVWYDQKDGVDMYEYVPSMSTSQREVYKRVIKSAIYKAGCYSCRFYPSLGYSVGCGRHGYEEIQTYYVAFSKDKSSFIEWHVDADDVDKEIREKEAYTRIPKQDLMPKAVNYDFLNE